MVHEEMQVDDHLPSPALLHAYHLARHHALRYVLGEAARCGVSQEVPERPRRGDPGSALVGLLWLGDLRPRTFFWAGSSE